MPQIFELFGFPISANTPEAEQHRRMAKCPFMNCPCDGGGNRFASAIDLSQTPELNAYFGDKKTVPSGVCSIQLKENQSPWIVCPRRLLVLGREDTAFKHQNQTEITNQILAVTNFPKGTKIGVWAEVKLRLSEISEDEDEVDKTFHYAFDYVIMPLKSVSQTEIINLLGRTWQIWQKKIIKSRFGNCKAK